MMQAVDRGLSWSWRVGLTVMLIMGILVPPLLLQLINELTANGASWWWRAAVTVAYFGVFWVVSYLAYRIYRHYAGFWRWPKLTKHDVYVVIGGYLLIIGCESIFQLCNQLLYQQNETQNNVAIEALMSGSTLALWLQAISAIFLTPIMEELVFRGVLTTLFWRQNWLKVLLSGLVFGSLHTTNTIPSFLIYFTMGLVLAGVYLWTGKLQTSIGLHFLINLGAMSLILLTEWS
ncbi:CPBP family intramembrane glutamic endopeptidase [Lactiplantibacillus mudanjiangensis]|nr:type II CAAX endopeptidase family protein [Lactiplantibacillus mudanjiangensis]